MDLLQPIGPSFGYVDENAKHLARLAFNLEEAEVVCTMPVRNDAERIFMGSWWVVIRTYDTTVYLDAMLAAGIIERIRSYDDLFGFRNPDIAECPVVRIVSPEEWKPLA